MKKYRGALILFLLFVAVSAMTWVITSLNIPPPRLSFGEQFDREIWPIIVKNYVDPVADTPEARSECFQKILAAGIPKCLDQYSYYYPKEEAGIVSQHTAGVVVTSGMNVEIESVEAEPLSPRLAYVRITEFSERTPVQFLKAIAPFVQTWGRENPHVLIIDVRNDHGGLLYSAETIGRFFSDNPADILITTQSRQRFHRDTVGSFEPPSEYGVTAAPGIFRDISVVCLVNERTASSAEFLAALMRDWKKSPVVGRTTVGKSSIQQEFSLTNGGMLWLVVEKYRVGNARIAVPLVPDYVVDDFSADDFDRISQGTLRYFANPDLDSQLRTAIAAANMLLKKK